VGENGRRERERKGEEVRESRWERAGEGRERERGKERGGERVGDRDWKGESSGGRERVGHLN